MRFAKSGKAISILAVAFLVATASAQSRKHQHCQAAGGMLLSNLGVGGQANTMGTATGDLKGAVSGTIVSSEVVGDNLVFHIQHHWVTDSGDTLSFDLATATTTAVAPGLYAVITYPFHINGGTGKFAGVTGDFNNIGEADLNTGQLVLRYSGKLCFADEE
jgi:hypothetical protein